MFLEEWLQNWGALHPEFRKFLKTSPENVQIAYIKALTNLTDQYFYNEAKKRDYLNMGEILYDAQANPPDPDAVFLKKLYNAIWAKEEELENQLKSMSLEELLNLNLRNWAYKQYEEIKRGLENEK